MQPTLTLPPLDIAIILLYMCGILTIGLLSVRRIKITGNVFFLAGRSLSWPLVGAALFASNISTIHLVGLTASGYNEGLVWGNFEWMASYTLILLSLVFAPFYFRTRIATLPEFLERRYSPASRSFLAFMAIVAAVFIHIGISLYAGAAVFQRFFGINVVTSIVIISTVVGVYTVLGGLRAVVITETVNTAILILGALLILGFSLAALPAHGIHSVAQLRAAAKPEQLSMLHTHDSAGLSWYAVLLGYPILGIWYWCTDQTIVQRVLGARSSEDAQLGPLMAGFLKILPVFLLVLPGVIAYVLFHNLIGSASNQTLPVLIEQLIPTGVRGVITAAVLAALMSAVAAALNSIGTLVAVDIVARMRPSTSDRAQVTIGRISSVVVMLLAMAWSTQGGRYSSIFEAINAIAADLAPPITVVFLWGVLWRRGTKQASLYTLIFGFALGVVAFIMDLPVFGAEKIITHRWGIPFMMQAWWMFCICSVVYVTVTLLTPPPAPESVEGLTWSHPLAALTQEQFKGLRDPRLIAAVLAVTVAVLYYIFR
ncbi:MAG TPA: sodium/solute symporter [Candidatus Aquilonibacter sp.]|jgi:SSS family solute:Na+ symporter|nr:sodium/solute symporter [Candidatus Aquilonibacter sp.]